MGATTLFVVAVAWGFGHVGATERARVSLNSGCELVYTRWAAGAWDSGHLEVHLVSRGEKFNTSTQLLQKSPYEEPELIERSSTHSDLHLKGRTEYLNLAGYSTCGSKSVNVRVFDVSSREE